MYSNICVLRELERAFNIRKADPTRKPVVTKPSPAQFPPILRIRPATASAMPLFVWRSLLPHQYSPFRP